MSPECVVVLLHELPGTHGVHDAPQVERRSRYATRRSAGSNEFYTANNSGMRISYVFSLALMEEYDEERQLEYNGRRYDIVRTYETKTGGIELTVQRSETDD